MDQAIKTRVFMSGRSQHVTIPAAFRFKTKEVYVRKDPQTGDLILQQRPRGLAEILAELNALDIPDDFLTAEGRAQGAPQKREDF